MIQKEKLVNTFNRLLKSAEHNKSIGRPGLKYGILIKKDCETDDEVRRFIEEWASCNHLNLVVWDCITLTDNDVKGKLVANQDGKTCSRLYPTIFDELDKENTVLLVENFDLAQDLVRHQVRHIIRREYVEDGKCRSFDNLLFVIATVNPDGTEGRKLLDPSELSSFAICR